MELLAIGIIVPWILVGFIAFITYAVVIQAARQADEFVLRLDALEQNLDSAVAGATSGETARPTAHGLEAGVPAPAFELPSLTGEARQTTLEAFRGSRVLLMFFRPDCSYCEQMAPELATLPTDGREGHPIPLVIASGGERENREFIARHKLKGPFLLQPGTDVSALYQVSGTPIGYLIDEQGTVVSGELAGSNPLLGAFRDPASVIKQLPSAPIQVSTGLGLMTTKSHLQREGLSAGSLAPEFTLPDLTDTQVSLGDYHGKSVLLVFSDPTCGPCQVLAPDLERLHRERREFLQVVMVSRGDLAANQAKAAEHGLTFPIVRQRHWEVSRAYGIFKTPVGYLVDSQGILASDVAVGGEAILALASSTTANRSIEEVASRGRT